MLRGGTVCLHLLYLHPRVHGLPVHIKEQRRLFASEVVIDVALCGIPIDEQYGAILEIEILYLGNLAALIVGLSSLGVPFLMQHRGAVEANQRQLDELAFVIVLREDLV